MTGRESAAARVVRQERQRRWRERRVQARRRQELADALGPPGWRTLAWLADRKGTP